MFYALVAVCEALFWVLLGGFAIARYLYGRRRLSLLFLAGILVNELWLVPLAVQDTMLNGRFSIFHADVLLEAAALPVVLLFWGRGLFRKLDRGAERYVGRVRALTEAEGLALPRALVAAVRRPLQGQEVSRQGASGRDTSEGAAVDHARKQRRGWYAHLAVFLVGQGLVQIALFAGFLEPTDGLYFGNGPTPSIGVGPFELTFDIAGIRRAWLVILAVDFLWSFSYTLWPSKRSGGQRAQIRRDGDGV